MTHEPFDETAKAFYQRLFKNWGLEVETEREVFSHSRTIDLAVTCGDTEINKLQNTVFAHFRRLNALELKGFYDPLTVANFFRIMMRVWALGDQKYEQLKSAKNESPDGDDTPYILANQMTVTMICVTKPEKILNQLKTEYRFVKQDNGIYHCDEILGKWIIHPSELDLVEKNYPLLPLARGKKLEDFIALCLDKGLKDYLQLIIDIGLATDPELIWQKILEVKPMKHLIREETWPIIDRFFQETPEAIGKLPTFQEALTSIRQQALEQGLGQGLVRGEQLGLVRGEQLGLVRGEQLGEQRTLIRQLRRKFTEVPETIVQQIEATKNIEQLDNWLDQIISANKLADIDFSVSTRF